MSNALQLAAIPDTELSANAAALATRVRANLAKIVRPNDGAKFVHDVKAVRDRIAKLRLTKEEAFEAKFPWDMAWLEGMRHTGALVASGQDAGTIRTGGQPKNANSQLSLSDLEIEPIESSRWQRLAGIHPEDWRTFEEEFYGDRREPTLMAALRLADDESPDNGRPWLRVYNVWNFQKCDERFGIQHPGQIPGQIVQNLNWYFTSPGDLVVDLFAGGGSTVDVCKYADDDFGNRKCLAYDIQPRRTDIKKHDMVKDGIPDVSKAKLVFLDPPYWAQMKGEYSGHETNLANLDLGTFYDSIVSIANAALAQIGPGAVVALIIGGAEFLGERGRGKDHALEIVSRVRGNLLQRIIVPYSTENYQAHDVTRTKTKKTTLNLYRDLLVWERP